MRLGDLCELIVDCEHKTAPTQGMGYPSIRTPNIGRGYFLLDGVNRVSEDTYRLWTRRAVPRPGDLIMAREAPVGNVAMIPQGLEPCLGQRTLLIRPDKTKVDPRYLAYLLVGDEVQATIHGMTNGVTVPHLNMKDVRTLKLPRIPELSAQRRIASVLSAFDDLIENNTRRIQILERMAQTIYREWFVNFRFPGHAKTKRVASPLGPIPQGWQPSAFTDIADILSGGTPSTRETEYWDGDIPWFTPRDATGSFYVIDTEKHITQEGVENCASEFYPKDTIFITARGTVGKLALAGVPMAVNQSCYAVRGKNGYGQRFVFLMLHVQIDYLKKNTGGATFDTIITDTFKRMSVARPPALLAAEFEIVSEPLIERVRLLHFQNVNLRRTRDLLLPKLISGALDVSKLDIESGGVTP